MRLDENQVVEIATNFMPKIKKESVEAMIDVVCHGLSVWGAAQKNNVTHQSLTKNLAKLKELEDKINLNKNELMKLIWTSLQVRSVYFEAIKQGFWEDFPDEGLDGVLLFSEKVGVISISELKSIIDTTAPAMTNFLEYLYEAHKQATGRPWRISFCFIVQLMLILRNIDLLNAEFLYKNGWDKTIASIVLKAAKNVREVTT